MNSMDDEIFLAADETAAAAETSAATGKEHLSTGGVSTAHSGAQTGAAAPPNLGESDSTLSSEDTKWLRFMQKYPKFYSEPLPKGMNEAVAAGEDPTMAYLRLENARLEHDIELLRTERALRAACMSSAASAAPPPEPDDFAKGLLG